MRRLDNPRRAYDWGSPHLIPHFLGGTGGGDRVAEVWVGTHALDPSAVEGPQGRVSLREVVGDLPFMLKLLAADRPLSIQVHPSAQLAEVGFAAEEAARIPIDAPERVYKDPRPKPEMVYALSTFDTLVGFRPTAEILRVLGLIEVPFLQDLADDLRRGPGFRGIVRILQRLLTVPPSRAEVEAVVAACGALAHQGIDVKRAYLTAVEIHEHHPGDVGVVISLLLNRLTLQPGEAAYLGTGIIHAHLRGLCVEVMVSSDNVLRAGLTGKHLDPVGLVQCLEKGMSRLARVVPEQHGFSTEIFSPGLGEFALAVTQSSPAEPDGVPLPDAGRSIIMCIGGEVEVVNDVGEKVSLSRGESVFADAADGVLRVHGLGEVAQAYTPTEDATPGVMNDLV